MNKKKVIIFGKEGCAKCTAAKDKVGHYINKWGLAGEIPIEFKDMESVEGLAEGADRDVWEIPTTIVEQHNSELARWSGEPPQSDSLRASLVSQ